MEINKQFIKNYIIGSVVAFLVLAGGLVYTNIKLSQLSTQIVNDCNVLENNNNAGICQ